MSDAIRTKAQAVSCLDTLATEFVNTAAQIARRHGAGDAWRNLELDLWKAVLRTLASCQRRLEQDGSVEDVWRKRFLVELTEEAFHVAVRGGARGPLLEMELDLYQAFRSVLGQRSQDFSPTDRE